MTAGVLAREVSVDAVPGDMLCLLGRFGLYREGAAVTMSSGGQRLLALLAVAGARTRSEAAETLWPDVAEERSLGNLRSALWRINQVCPGVVETGQQLRLSQELAIDSARFLRVVRVALRDGGLHPGATGHGSSEHVGTVPELLPGWFDDWVLDERDRIRQLALQVLELVVAEEIRRGRFGAALQAALEAVRAEPLRESAHRAVIEVHLAQGNVAAARAHYQRLVGLLHTELGVRPSALTQTLLHSPQIPGIPFRDLRGGSRIADRAVTRR